MREPVASVVASNEIAIRDAACIIVVDNASSEPTLLLGRRRSDQIFLPNKWVFPGGRVDESDRGLAASFAGTYAPVDLAPGIRPFALAALRELHEETGLLIATETAGPKELQGDRPATLRAAYAPAPHYLIPVARAITPPGRVRRYDTWFFVAPRTSVISDEGRPDGELLDLSWFTLNEARRLDLPNITRLVLEELALRLGATSDTARHSLENIPFYAPSACGFQRTLISCKIDPSLP